MIDLPALTIADLQGLLRRREVSPRDVIEAMRTRIGEIDPQVEAYLSLDFEAAAKEAENADVGLPLGGVPIAIKDIISVVRSTVHVRLENPAQLLRDV